MATRIVNVCDICGAEGDDVHEHTFGIGRDSYEIHLCARDGEQLRKRYAPYIDHGRRVTGKRPASARPASARRRSADIRRWARANGHPEIGGRGRIPGDIVAEYDAAR